MSRQADVPWVRRYVVCRSDSALRAGLRGWRASSTHVYGIFFYNKITNVPQSDIFVLPDFCRENNHIKISHTLS